MNINDEDNDIDEKSEDQVTMKKRICKQNNDNTNIICKIILKKSLKIFGGQKK